MREPDAQSASKCVGSLLVMGLDPKLSALPGHKRREVYFLPEDSKRVLHRLREDMAELKRRA